MTTRILYSKIILTLSCILLAAQISYAVPAGTTCYSFDDDTVPVANKEHAFNVYGNGHLGFLHDWHVTSGTPSIYNTNSIAGITPYDGYQYGLLAVCDAGSNWSEGVSLGHYFVQGQTYTVTLAVRNAPLPGAGLNPIDINFVLLHDTIPYTYNNNTGCSVTPAIPAGSQTVHTITNFTTQTWQLVTFTFTANATYSQLWFRTSFSSGASLTTSLFCFDHVCVEDVPSASCYSFDDDTVPVTNKEHAFNIYGNGHSGFLHDWHVTSGTPSIYNTNSIAGISSYDGYQYGLIGVCDVGNNWSEGVSLGHNFVQGRTYTVTLAVRSAPLPGTNINPIDINFILLHDTIPYIYNNNTGCSITPGIPSGSQTVHTISNLTSQTWQLVTFTFTANDNYTQLWFKAGFSTGASLTTSLFCFDAVCVTDIPPATCYSFDDDTVTFANKEHAFNIYGNGHAGFLHDWHVTSGTPSIYNAGSIAGITPYDGYQYGLLAVCDVGNNWSEGVSLAHSFVQGQTYTVTLATRNAPLTGAPINPIDINFILLHDTIPYNYNTNTGCSVTPSIPSGSQTVYTISNYTTQTWQLVTFTFTAHANYSQLWFRTSFSPGASLITSLFCFDDVCVTDLGQSSCNLQVDLGPDVSTPCMESNGTILSPNITGGTGAYHVAWHAIDMPDDMVYYGSAINQFAGDSAVVGLPGTYIAEVTDSSGCFATDTIRVLNSNSTLQIQGPYTICSGSDVNLRVVGTEQVVQWTKYENGQFVNMNNSTVVLRDTPTVSTYYIAHVIDGSSGCQVALVWQVTVDSVCDVWPGDANSDGIANNADILTIGLDYSSTGPVRSGASLVWIGQAATNWANNTPNGPNQKYADCDGNGIVNADDTLAVTENYALVHSKADAGSPGAPAIFVKFPANYTITAGQTVNVPIYLGNTNLPIDSIYGIAFDVDYDNTVIDPSLAELSINGSWLGNNGGNLISFRRDLYDRAKTPVAIVRTSHTSIGGNGLLATMTYKVKGNLRNNSYLNFGISNVTAVKVDGTIVSIDNSQSVDSVEALATGIDQLTLSSEITIYPNPTNQQLVVDCGAAKIEQYMVTDLLGKQVLSLKGGKDNVTTIDVSSLSEGIYVLTAKTSNAVANIKFVIAR